MKQIKCLSLMTNRFGPTANNADAFFVACEGGRAIGSPPPSEPKMVPNQKLGGENRVLTPFGESGR